MKFKKSAVKKITALSIAVLLAICIFVFFSDILNVILYILKILLPFILAYLISLAANPLAERLQMRFKLPKGLTAIIVIILIVGIIGGCATGIIWKIASEVKSIYQQFPQIYDNITKWFSSLSDNFSQIYNILPADIQSVITSIGDNLQASAAEFINKNYRPVMYGAGNFAKTLPSVFVAIIVFILSLFFMMSNEDEVKKITSRLIPKKSRQAMRRVSGEIKRYLGGYVKAQLIIMLIASVVICTGLTVLRVDYAMIIALGIAVFDALPFFGSGAILIPWSLISFVNSDFKIGLGMLIIYLAVIFTRQMIEPKIVSSNIGINPLYTLMAMYTGYKIFSIGGMIVGPLILMLFISFYKAGVFDGLISLIKKLITALKRELKEIFDFTSLK